MKELNFYRSEEDGKTLLDLDESSSHIRLEGLNHLPTNSTPEFAVQHAITVSQTGSLVAVQVGSPAHVTNPEHYVQWILLQTENGGLYRFLYPGDAPKAYFLASINEIQGAYAYCSKHGLWKADIIPALPIHSNDVACSAEFTQGCINNLTESEISQKEAQI